MSSVGSDCASECLVGQSCVDGQCELDDVATDCEPGTAAMCSCLDGSNGAATCGNDGRSGPCVCAQSELQSNLGDNAFIYINGTTVDVTQFVLGGSPPYTCQRYEGDGSGTMPAGVSLDSTTCVLSGEVNLGLGDLPGFYGFVVEVVDSRGTAVEVPVGYPGPTCSPAGSLTAVAPAPFPVQTNLRSGEVGFVAEVSDMCGEPEVADPTQCTSQYTANITCSGGSANCTADLTGATLVNPAVCGQMRFPIALDVGAHQPLRSDGPLAWFSSSIELNYTQVAYDGLGQPTNTCGAQRVFACHFESVD